MELESQREEDRKRKRAAAAAAQAKLEREKKRKEVIQKARKAIQDQARKLSWKLVELAPNKFVASKPGSTDQISIQIVGTTIKTMTDKISMPNHENAEEFLRGVSRTMGEKWKIFHRHPGDKHAHEHTHTHLH